MGIYYQDDTVEIRVYTANELVDIDISRKQELNRRQQEKAKQKAEDYVKNINIHRKAKLLRTTAKLKTDPLFKLRHNIRNLIRNSLKKQGFSKNTKTHSILGCSFEEFKQHIQQQFSEGMTWQNHGAWEYDHIIPLSYGKTEQEIVALNHYTNFQPLWKQDNRTKSNKFSS